RGGAGFRRLLGAAYRVRAGRVGLRLSADDLRQPARAQPARRPLPDAAAPLAQAAGAGLQPPGLGLAAHHLAVAVADLPNTEGPGGAHPAEGLRGRAAPAYGHRPGARRADGAVE